MRYILILMLATAAHAEECMTVKGDHIRIDRNCKILMALERLETQSSEMSKHILWLEQVVDQQRKDRETMVKADKCVENCTKQLGDWQTDEPKEMAQERQQCFKACNDKYSVPGHC